MPEKTEQEAKIPQRQCASNTALSYGAKGISIIKPFRSGSGVWQTDGRTDRL